jgi:hypothetical protein
MRLNSYHTVKKKHKKTLSLLPFSVGLLKALYSCSWLIGSNRSAVVIVVSQNKWGWGFPLVSWSGAILPPALRSLQLWKGTWHLPCPSSQKRPAKFLWKLMGEQLALTLQMRKLSLLWFGITFPRLFQPPIATEVENSKSLAQSPLFFSSGSTGHLRNTKLSFIYLFIYLRCWGLNSGPSPWATPPALVLWRVFLDRVSGNFLPGCLRARDPPLPLK